jgi:hypothetical protein
LGLQYGVLGSQNKYKDMAEEVETKDTKGKRMREQLGFGNVPTPANFISSDIWENKCCT